MCIGYTHEDGYYSEWNYGRKDDVNDDTYTSPMSNYESFDKSPHPHSSINNEAPKTLGYMEMASNRL